MKNPASRFSLGLSLAAAVAWPVGAGMGLTTKFVDVVLPGVMMGKVYDVGRVQSQTFTLTNMSSIPLSIAVEKEIPHASYLQPGYEAIPDLSWIVISPEKAALAPGETIEGRVTLRVPKDKRWRGRHFQAGVWTHSSKGNLAVGLRSRVRFSVETSGPRTTDPEAGKEPVLAFVTDVSGPELVPAGKLTPLKRSLKIINRGKDPLRVRLRGISHNLGGLPDGIVPAPNPDFLKVTPEVLDVRAGEVLPVKLMSVIPGGAAHAGQTYGFVLRADILGDGKQAESVFEEVLLRVRPEKMRENMPGQVWDKTSRKLLILCFISFKEEKMKKWTMRTLMAMATVMALGAGAVQAATTDALTITITPNAGYDVDIDTTGVTLNFPAVSLDADNNVVLPATVTINSSLATTELQMDATLTGGWSLGSSNALDTLQAWALFTSTTVASIPNKTGDNFDDTNDRVVSSVDVGDTVKYEDGTTNMDDLAAGAKRHLWFRFHTPATTTDTAQKSLHILLTAEAPN